MFPNEIIRPTTGHKQEIIPMRIKKRSDLDDICGDCPFTNNCTLKENIDPQDCPYRNLPGDAQPN